MCRPTVGSSSGHCPVVVGAPSGRRRVVVASPSGHRRVVVGLLATAPPRSPDGTHPCEPVRTPRTTARHRSLEPLATPNPRRPTCRLLTPPLDGAPAVGTPRRGPPGRTGPARCSPQGRRRRDTSRPACRPVGRVRPPTPRRSGCRTSSQVISLPRTPSRTSSAPRSRWGAHSSSVFRSRWNPAVPPAASMVSRARVTLASRADSAVL